MGVRMLVFASLVLATFSIGPPSIRSADDPGDEPSFSATSDGEFGLAGHSHIRFATTSVTVGARSLMALPTISRGKRSATVARGEVVEEIRDIDGAVEQSWSFTKRPEGRGELVVRIRADDATLRGADERGLVFEDRDSARVRYGAGTWVDAVGRRVPVPARFDDGVIALTVPEDVLGASVFPAVLDPTISAEINLGPVFSGPSHGEAHAPAAAFDGTNFLVVWDDDRAAELVYGARVSPSGTVLDPVGFQVAFRQRGAWPSVAFGSNEYLVAWKASSGAVVGVRIGKNGARLDASELPIAPGQATFFVATAFNGTNYVVTFQTTAGLSAVRVSPAGTILDTTPVPIMSSATTVIPRRLACGVGHCLVLWQSGAALRGVRVDASLGVLDATPIAIPSGVSDPDPRPANGRNGPSVIDGPRVAYDGVNYVVQYTAAGRSRLAHVHPGTGVVTVLPTDLSGSAGGVAFDGVAYAVLAGGSAVRVATDGSVLGTATGLGAQVGGAFACGPIVCLLGSQRNAPTHTAGLIYASRLSSANTWLDPGGFRLGSSADDQRIGGAASSKTGGLVVWKQENATPYSPKSSAVYGARLNNAGTLLDPTGIQLSPTIPSPEEGYWPRPRVGSDGTNYLVVWSTPVPTTDPNPTALYGVRVNASGALLDAAPFVVLQASSKSMPWARVTFDGTNYLVTWGGMATRVSPGGVVLDSPPLAVPVPIEGMAFNGKHYLVAFSKSAQGESGTYDLFGIRLTTTLDAVDDIPFPISIANGDQHIATVASDGSDFFVAWTDERNAVGATSSYSSDIYGSRVSAAGSVLDPNGIPIGVSPVGKQARNDEPSLVYSAAAKRYLVAWTRSPADGFFPYASSDVLGAEVETSGVVRHPGTFALAASTDGEFDPVTTSLVGSTVLLAYGRNDSNNPFGSLRVRARIIDLEETTGDAGTPPSDGGEPATPTDGGSAPPGDGGSGTGYEGDAGSDQHDDSGRGGVCNCRVVAGRTAGATPSGIALVVGLLLVLRRRGRRSGTIEDFAGQEDNLDPSALRALSSARSARGGTPPSAGSPRASASCRRR